MKITLLLYILLLSCSTTTTKDTNQLIKQIEVLFTSNSNIDLYFKEFDQINSAASMASKNNVIIETKNEECPQLIIEKNINDAIESVLLSCEMGKSPALDSITYFKINEWKKENYSGGITNKRLNIKRFNLVSIDKKRLLQFEDFQKKVKLILWKY